MDIEPRNLLLERIEALYRNVVAALHAGDHQAGLALLQTPYSSDDLLAAHGVADVDDFSNALKVFCSLFWSTAALLGLNNTFPGISSASASWCRLAMLGGFGLAVVVSRYLFAWRARGRGANGIT